MFHDTHFPAGVGTPWLLLLANLVLCSKEGVGGSTYERVIVMKGLSIQTGRIHKCLVDLRMEVCVGVGCPRFGKLLWTAGSHVHVSKLVARCAKGPLGPQV
jgi:hypothetical protein